jgi:hypothetical protein
LHRLSAKQLETVPIACAAATLGSIVGTVSFSLERQQVAGGRWNREAPKLACNLACGNSATNALSKKILADRVLAHRLKNDISETMSIRLPFDS